MAQREAFRFGAAFAREVNAAVALDAQQAVSGHAFERGGYGRRRYVQLFREARADGLVLILSELPDYLEVIFAGDAGGFAGQRNLPRARF